MELKFEETAVYAALNAIRNDIPNIIANEAEAGRYKNRIKTLTFNEILTATNFVSFNELFNTLKYLYDILLDLSTLEKYNAATTQKLGHQLTYHIKKIIG